ncbi:hypothetical protein CcCBS67573_g06379 [Chytriomyces confervae]|uniref:Exostosin GT47 domain-containing protein n=1 Tax=Chytriomyces confervae TaxID=246404 RepID=A0A507F3Y4_9FUNG|nr:hypothetical protein CcCBS67573_g06379 [Chytriomyces confervae]
MPQKEFYKSYLSTARFAPHGNGLDSYRVWETLLLGSYPIVKTSSLDSLYQDLPVIILDEWHDLTPEMLQKEFARFRRMKHNYERLYSRYWRNVMRQ